MRSGLEKAGKLLDVHRVDGRAPAHPGHGVGEPPADGRDRAQHLAVARLFVLDLFLELEESLLQASNMRSHLRDVFRAGMDPCADVLTLLCGASQRRGWTALVSPVYLCSR